MTLTDGYHLVVSADDEAQTGASTRETPSATGVVTKDDRPWPVERDELTISVTTATSRRAWFQRWMRDAMELFNLPPNWNGYGERPVHALSLKRAARILDAMDFDGPQPAMSPRHDGTVQLEWHNDDSSIELVVAPNASAEAWTFVGDDEDSWTVETTVDARRVSKAIRDLIA